jgi:hypothetical protein
MAVRIEKQAEPIPGYRLLDRLGGGGFGEVWRAEAPGGLLKAIKFVYGDLQDAGDDGQRAEQELKALRRVQTVRHPYILSLERYDIIDGQLLVVMELADKNLWDRYKECRAAGQVGIPREELLGYMDDTAEALDLMNLQYGLQHLDIKPQNLFLVHNHVKVADFGLVKDLEGMKASVTGGVTPVYAAPETFDGWVSRFSDQYSLAIVYQELLTGCRPFLGNNVRQLVLQHLQGSPDLSSLPAADQLIVARALAKDPEERFATCKEMIQALRQGGAARVTRPVPGGLPEGAAEPGTPTAFGPPGVGEGPGSTPYSPGGPAGGRLASEPRAAGTPSFAGPPTVVPPDADEAQEARGELVDSSARPTFCIRLREERPTESPADTAANTAPPAEVQGDGCLFPALVIGVGGVGQAVLRQLRATLQRRFGGADALPNVRLLLLDTDANVMRTATQGEADEALLTQEVFLTPLNRPAHYLKARDGRVALDSWLDTTMLYRIPRSRATMGVRALGRLAFCDHYRIIGRRLRAELEACLDPLALSAADRQTRLGLRSNRPRVYIVTGLGGGTGGGMFLDLAYAVRAQLRSLGYGPDVVGLLTVPAAHVPPAAGEAVAPDRTPLTPNNPRHMAQLLALGNAYAALTELRYFARPNKTFQARYYDREPGLQDAEAPFRHCVVLPRGEVGGQGDRQLAALAAEYLARDLCSPLHLAAEKARAEVPAPPSAERGLFCQTFGLYQWSAPHRQLVQQAGRSLCARLLQRWMSKDAEAVRGRVGPWVEEQWAQEGWSANTVGGKLDEAGRHILGRPSEEAFAAIFEPIAALVADARSGARPPAPDVPLVAAVVEQLEAAVGRPPAEEIVGHTAQLPEALREVVGAAVASWGQRVAELVVGFIEQPEYRLAGAEEAVRQIISRIERVLAEHEPRFKSLAALSADAFGRLQQAVIAVRRMALGKARQAPTAAELLELLGHYARTRYQSLLEQQLVAAYVSLRGQLSDQLREINFCRVRLTELLQAFGGAAAADPAAAAAERQPGGAPLSVQALGSALFPHANGKAAAVEEAPPPVLEEATSAAPGQCLFPNGCATLEQALIEYLASVTPEALQRLDVRVQAVIQRQFTALVQVCLASANVLQNLERAMRQEAEAFVAEDGGRSAAGASVAELFLELSAEPDEARRQLAEGFARAAPDLRGMREFGIMPAEVSVLMVPDHPASARIRELAGEALPDSSPTPATGGDDLVLYREVPYLPLGGLEQLGPTAEEAYRQMLTANHFTPHTRTDITFKSP